MFPINVPTHVCDSLPLYVYITIYNVQVLGPCGPEQNRHAWDSMLEPSVGWEKQYWPS